MANVTVTSLRPLLWSSIRDHSPLIPSPIIQRALRSVVSLPLFSDVIVTTFNPRCLKIPSYVFILSHISVFQKKSCIMYHKFPISGHIQKSLIYHICSQTKRDIHTYSVARESLFCDVTNTLSRLNWLNLFRCLYIWCLCNCFMAGLHHHHNISLIDRKEYLQRVILNSVFSISYYWFISTSIKPSPSRSIKKFHEHKIYISNFRRVEDGEKLCKDLILLVQVTSFLNLKSYPWF